MRRIALSLLFVSSSVSFAQPKKGPAPKPVPGVPTLTTPVSLGLTIGKKNEVELTGTNLAGVKDAVIFGCPVPIKTTIVEAKDPAKIKVAFDVPENLQNVGLYQ